MVEFTILELNKIIGETKANILRRYGTQAAITDLAILLGGYVSKTHLVQNRMTKRMMAGCWWTKTQNKLNNELSQTYITHINNEYYYTNPKEIQIGTRPTIHYSSLFKDNLIDHAIVSNTTIETKYGEYPQWIVETELSEKLEQMYNLEILCETGKEYNIDKKYKEYEYGGGKYIRLIPSKNETNTFLSNGRNIIKDEAYWIKVIPVEWIVSKSEDIMISKNILIAGIEYNNKNEESFEKTNIKKFLDNNFSIDIIPSRKTSISNEKNYYLKKLIKLKEELNNSKEICNDIEKIKTKKLP